MASNRKKQDEKHLKILRNLVSLPANKQCFDCSQRGPTYVNTTIGSFVCTSCSGMLRGLTPPHRVKSISMATFTAEEIDFIKARGNEYCKNVWLAVYNKSNQDTKNEQNIKDFMVAKYERKLYYMEPSVTLKYSKAIRQYLSLNESASNQTTLVEDETNKSIDSDTKICKMNSSSPASSLSNSVPMKLPEPQKTNMFKTNNVSSFSGCDPFAPMHQQKSSAAITQDQPSFANFDNNPIFHSATPSTTTGMTTSVSFPVITKSRPPSEDRYAALKDLDCIMKMQQEANLGEWTNQTPQPTTDWAAGNGGWPSTKTLPLDAPVSSNPFQVSSLVDSSSQNSNTHNPFRTNVDMSNGNIWGSPWNPLPSSQSMVFPNSNWPGNGNITIGPGNSGNPFL